MSGPQRSPSQTQLVPKSPSLSPRVFEFPEDCYPETPNTNFDFEDFVRAAEGGSSVEDLGTPKSASCYYNLSGQKSPQQSFSPGPAIQLNKPKKNFGKTLSYPPKGSAGPTSSQSFTAHAPSSLNFGQKHSAKRRNSSSSYALAMPKSPLSPTVVASLSSHNSTRNFRHSVSPGSLFSGSSGNLKNSDSATEDTRMVKKHINKSQSCLNESNTDNSKCDKSSARRSTSDLTDMADTDTDVTILSCPRRRGSMKGGLAYLASRRGSRDSQCSNASNVSNEDVGPLNFSGHPRLQQRRTSNFLELPVPNYSRPRVHSLPEQAYNPRAGDDLYRLRAFSITNRGVVNRGDSIISRRSRSNTSVNSSRNSNVSGERSPFDGSCCSGQGVGIDSSESEVEEIIKYRVILMGDSGVGKTALVSQFMTSEYMNTYDASLDDEFGEKTVSILLDGEESEMIFIDHPHVEMSVENMLSTYDPHACIVIYSIDSRSSFHVAEEMLNYLWREHCTQDRSVIVVGNKSDLARSRTVTANEGKQLAASRGCKFIETSSGIQHNVDELLVGVLKQIRLRESRDKKIRRQSSKSKILSKLHSSKTALNLNLAREILNKMCLNDSKSKSCENLHVL